MLRRAPSLALRASLIFMSIYALIFLAVVGVSAAISWADRGAGNLRGAVIAAEYAAAEIRESGGRLSLPGDGRFAHLAARNPGLWLVVIKEGRTFTNGAVGQHAMATVERLRSVTDSVLFRVPGQEMPLAAGRLIQGDLSSGPLVVAAGGVHPATLSTRESIHLLLEPEIALMLVIITVISLVGMLLAVPAFARALRPIAVEVAAIGPGDPGRRLREQKAPKELMPLVRGFNAALDRLEVELGRRKRFIADVAHELRTPLAVVSLQAEGLADGEGKADLQRGLRRLTNLVAQMLDLERLSLAGRQSSDVDLVGVTRDVVADLAPLAIQSGYDLSLLAPETPVRVIGDEHAIARAVTNLIGNSIAHGGGSGAISVYVSPDRMIDVCDEGQGVPGHLQPSLFEPFVRGDLNGDTSGLGLHLTREIMDAHRGEVCLMPDPTRTNFRLTFPPLP